MICSGTAAGGGTLDKSSGFNQELCVKELNLRWDGRKRVNECLREREERRVCELTLNNFLHSNTFPKSRVCLMDSFLPSGGGRRALELVFQYGMRTDKRMEFEDEEEEDVDDDSCCCF